jgi:hypothetical protein
MLEKLKALFFISKEKQQSLDNSTSKGVSEDIELSDYSMEEHDQKFQNILMRAIESQDQDGYDYLEFRKTIISLSDFNENQEKKYHAALNMADAVGVQKDYIVSTAKHYLKILDQEKIHFESILKKKVHKLIELKKQEIKHTQNLIQDKQQQIAILKNDILNHQNSLKDLEIQQSEAHNKIEENKEGFYSALKFLQDEINRDIQRIEHLK